MHCDWHVNDLRMSNISNDLFSTVIDYLSKGYGKEAPLTVSGKVHNYLGMILNYSIDGKVQICQDDYIDGMHTILPKNK